MDDITLGVILSTSVEDEEVDKIVQWILLGRLALLTGEFSGFGIDTLKYIAEQAKATYCEPLAQWLRMPTSLLEDIGEADDALAMVAYPCFFLVFGYFRSITLSPPSVLPAGWVLGDDLVEKLVFPYEIAPWEMNDVGSPMVRNLGAIKVEAINFDRWCPHLMQTCLWMGTSQPSKSSQAKYKGKGKGKGKQTLPVPGKGKGKRRAFW